MEAIILAGGLGTRLASRLGGVPKAMAPVAGRPFLEILLDQLDRAGCARVTLSVGHLHTVIQDHFGARYRGMSLDYAVESSPLGTGGAIRAALQKAAEPSVLVLNGDTFLQADYADMMRFHRAHACSLTLAVTHRDDLSRYGRVLVSGDLITGFEEKDRAGPGFINAGAYIMEKNLVWPKALPEQFSFEREFLEPEVALIAPAAYPVKGVFLDIGIPEDLDRAQTELASFMPRSGVFPTELSRTDRSGK
jgi:D-glycero-alpha-D-manno-heptose 1-phosphate guanylyltransferase